MSDISDVIEQTAPEHPQLNVESRKSEVEAWDESRQRAAAQEEGVELGADHWQVLDFLRTHYIDKGMPASGRELLMDLEEAFDGKGGGSWLYTLFPQGPVTQGSRIAGVPVPPHSSDKSFGSSM